MKIEDMPNTRVNPKNDDLVYVRYKFKYEDNVIIKRVSRTACEELKNASTVEFCEIIN